MKDVINHIHQSNTINQSINQSIKALLRTHMVQPQVVQNESIAIW